MLTVVLLKSFENSYDAWKTNKEKEKTQTYTHKHSAKANVTNADAFNWTERKAEEYPIKKENINKIYNSHQPIFSVSFCSVEYVA